METVERERPVRRAISARLAVPLIRRKSTMRKRLNSRRELKEPEPDPGLVATLGTLSGRWAFCQGSEE